MMSVGRDGADRATVQSVERSLDILEALAASGQGIGIVELSSRVSLHVSTVHRLLATLVSRGYARQHAHSGQYALGFRLLSFSQAVREQSDLRTEARNYLMRLTEQSGETSNLVVLHQSQAMYVDQVQSPRLARIFAEIGRCVPLHSTGGGKAILACFGDEDRAEFMAGHKLESLTPHTITTRDALDQALAQVRLQGYAVDDEEQEEGVRCVAAPVRDHTGQVVAALSVSGPTSRMARERIAELAAMVVDSCVELSRELGYEAN